MRVHDLMTEATYSTRLNGVIFQKLRISNSRGFLKKNGVWWVPFSALYWARKWMVIFA